MKDEDFLLKFVVNMDGERIGETVSMDEGRVIVKKGSEFFAFNKEDFENRFGDLVLKDVDWTVAKALGENWKKKHYSPLED